MATATLEQTASAVRAGAGHGSSASTIGSDGLRCATPVSALGSRSQDRRIVRSKAALRRALIDSMEECGWEAVTVNDLCARADVTRGTFYNHYKDKDDLLESIETEVIADFSGTEQRMGELTIESVAAYVLADEPLPLLVELFDELHAQGDFLHAVLGPGGDVRFAPRLRDSVCTCLIESILHERYRTNPTPFVDYYVSFFASAYLGIISRWIDRGMPESSEEMARIAVRLLFIKPGESIEL